MKNMASFVCAIVMIAVVIASIMKVASLGEEAQGKFEAVSTAFNYSGK
jgi:hypothetical protein